MGSQPYPQITYSNDMGEYIDADLFILNPSITSTGESTISRIKSLY